MKACLQQRGSLKAAASLASLSAFSNRMVTLQLGYGDIGI